MLGVWLDWLPKEELSQLSKKLQVQLGDGQPPMKQSMLIMIKAPNGINSKGQTMWWEAIELWILGKRVTPYPLATQNMDQCVLVPSVNQNLAKKGLTVDRIVLNCQKFNGPAANPNIVHANTQICIFSSQRVRELGM